MAKWFYQRNGVTHGPVDSTQLKRLAQAGELIPDDLLRREDMQSWTKASKVQGLFGVAGHVARQQASSTTPAVPASDEVGPPPTINAAATSSSSDGKKSKLRRNVIIGVVVLLVIGFIGHVVDLRKMNATYAEATSLWDAGQKQQAVALYRSLKDREELRDEKRQVVFQRLVDHEVANGSTDAARQLLKQAVQAGVVVTPSTNEGQKLLAAIQAETVSRATTQREPRESLTAPSTSVVRRTYLSPDEQQAMAHPGTEYGGVVFVDQTRLLIGWLGDFSRRGVVYKRLKSRHYHQSNEDVEYEEEFEQNSNGQVCKKRIIWYSNGQKAAVNDAEGSDEEEILWTDKQCYYWDKDGTSMTSHQWHARHFGDDYGAMGGRLVERRGEELKKQFIDTYKRLEQEDRTRGR